LVEIIRSTSGLSAEAIEAQREFYQSHPPSCLTGFRTAPADLSGHSFDGHGEILNSYWTISCPCGADQFKIHGYNAINPDYSSETLFFSVPLPWNVSLASELRCYSIQIITDMIPLSADCAPRFMA
jgi:hypothetical protein